MNYEDTVMKNLGEKYSGEYLADSIIEDIEAQAEATWEIRTKDILNQLNGFDQRGLTLTEAIYMLQKPT